MPEQWRLVDSGLVEAAESAAIDEAILEAHASEIVPNTLHYYIRSEPTVSVGYFQRLSESVDILACESLGVKVVRRKSGGSSIYTDRGQLIYGLIVGERDLPEDRTESFRKVCTAIARAISSFGAKAEYRPMNDIEISGKKVSGNAQLRRKGSVLQHGTIILSTDLEAMDRVLNIKEDRRSISKPSERVVALCSVVHPPPSIEELKARVTFEIAREFGIEFVRGSLTARERASVRSLVECRYSRREWNEKF